MALPSNRTFLENSFLAKRSIKGSGEIQPLTYLNDTSANFDISRMTNKKLNLSESRGTNDMNSQSVFLKKSPIRMSQNDANL